MIALPIGSLALAARDFDRTAYLKRQFGGWTGISFHCRANPESSDNKQLCEWSRARFESLASAKKLRIVLDDADIFSRADERLARRASGTGLLTVELELFSTRGESYGKYMAVRASPYYIEAIETFNPNEIEKRPRSGALILWEQTRISSSATQHEGSILLAQYDIEQMLEELISDFSAGQQ
jgi:hypothetical protein